jgi:FkbM family methyltransferase
VNAKALARFLYANVPGVAAIRFAAKDLMASRLGKPEYRGVRWLSIGNGLIVDIGANRGQSIAAFRRLVPTSNIVAFEPEPTSARRLAFRYLADRSVTIHACALGTQSGAMTFFVPSYGRWNCDGMAATDRKTATEWLNDSGRMYRFDEAKLAVAEHAVECRTLDSYKLSPQLIKLHTQGAELDILKGARQTVQQHRPALMCAFPTPTVTDFLADLGYRPYVYGHECFTPGIAIRPVTFTWYLTDSHTGHVPIGTAL